MHDLLIANCVVGFLCALSLSGCSALIKTGDRQCKSNVDCTSSGLGTLCVDQVCVEGNGCQGAACMMSDAAVGNGKCSSDSDCMSASAPRCNEGSCVSLEVAQQWLCAGPLQPSRSDTVRYEFHIVDFISGDPPKNIVAHACLNNDVVCAKPIATYLDKDGTGNARFELPYGFLGFFEVRSDALVTLLYVTKPIVKNTLTRDLPVVTADTLQLTASLSGIPFDPTKGLALLEALDCTDTPAGGVQFKVEDVPADRFYLVDQIPSWDATVTSYDAQYNTATGGFSNVPSGYVTFSAYLGLAGPELGSFNAQVRANSVTFVEMHF